MKNTSIALFLITILCSCNTNKSQINTEAQEATSNTIASDTLTKHLKPFQPDLPTIREPT